MKKIVYIVFVALLAAVTGPVWGQHTLGNIPEGWKVKANGDSVPVVNGTATITDGATVVLTPPNPAFVKSVTLTDAPAPSCRRITLDTVQHHFVAQDCDTLTGTLAANVKISIANGATVTLDGVSINADGNWTSGNYAGITCLGNATIILKDGTTDTVKGFYDEYPGIYVPVGSTLTIQGGALGTGKLIASSNGYGAGIGGGYGKSCGNINIQGGDIKAMGGSNAAGIGSGYNASCDTITITGGTIEATGGSTAAGIGSGYHHASCSAITISGGNITATGGSDAAGIGSGYGSSCDTIAISGGNVIASGGSGAAGIGSAWSTYVEESSCGNITITGGTVNATGGDNAAGIGSGYDSDSDQGGSAICGNITITGGTVNATSGTRASGIGSGKGSSCGAITITSDVTRVTATSDAAVSIGYGEDSSCGTITFGTQQMYNGTVWTTNPESGQTYGGLKLIISTISIIIDTWELTPASAPAPSCRRITLDTVQHHFVAQDCDTLTGTLGANVKISIAAGATVTLRDATINGVHDGDYEWAGITCLGNATIILSGTNTVKGFNNEYPGIQAAHNYGEGGEYTLTIQGTGSLTASSNGKAAGIGAAKNENCGNITISGGTITATGGDQAAGIGGSYYGACGNISISGGTITASGGDDAAGIGSGADNVAACGNITISGGTITASGRYGGAGIGSGNNGASCGNITITSGVTSVTATKGASATNSIGAGKNGTCGTVTFGTQQMYNGTTWTTNPTNGQTYGGLNFTIKTTTSNNDTWELTIRRVDLSQITADSVMQDGDVLTGTLTANVKISIANGATVTLDNVTIKGTGSSSYKWAGITCLGDATIILKDGTTDTVRGFYENYPGIYVPANSTLTIQGGSEGTGKLIASSNGYGAGIGGWYYHNCGNINIQSGDIKATGGQMAAGIGGAGSGNFGTITISGGTINATGGFDAAGIGSGYNANCDTITITGGTIEATGGDFAAGIGSGYQASCSAITITSDVTRVTATKGADVPNSIGAGKYGTCGTVTIGGTVYWQNNAYVGDGATYLMQSQIVYPAP